MKPKKKKINPIKDALKAARKESREDEIKAHGKPVLHTKVVHLKISTIAGKTRKLIILTINSHKQITLFADLQTGLFVYKSIFLPD